MTKITYNNYTVNTNSIYNVKNILPQTLNIVNKDLIDHKKIFKNKINSLVGDDIILSNPENFIKKYLQIGLIKGLKEGNFGIFDKYNKLEDYKLNKEINTKIKKYFPIHEQIIFKVLNQEIDNLEKKDKQNIKNVLNNLIKKYFYIIFIFSEKIKLSDLEKNLSLSLEELSFDFASAKTDIQNLDKFGDEVVEKLKKRFDLDEENQAYASEKFFATMYRRLYREIETKNEKDEILEKKSPENKEKNKEIGKKIDKGVEIGKKMENEIKTAFSEIFYIFETWVEFGFKDDEKLKNLQIFTRKIFEGILYLKKQNIAFNSLEYKNFNNVENFLKSIEDNILNFLKDKKSEHFKSEFKEEFLDFLKSTLESKETGEKTKLELIKKLKEKTEKIALSRIPEETKYLENLDIENIDFTEWTKIPESQKYDFVFNKVIGENGKIKFADFLHITDEKFEKFFELYYEYLAEDKDKSIEKNDKIKPENKENEKIKERKKLRITLEKQFLEIKESEGKSIENFIKNDVNNLNVLILWWRFILKYRFLEKNNLELNVENFRNNKKLKEKEYGVVEKISEKLKEENVEIIGNVIFSIDGKVRNTSQEKDFIGLQELIKSLKKGITDLSKEKIELTTKVKSSNSDKEEKNEEKIIGKIQDLYMPKGITTRSSSSIDRDYSDIESYINIGIDVCYDILKGKIPEKNSFEESYTKILIENKIIDSLNPEDLTIERKDNLQKLAETLKFIKNRRKYLRIMVDIAEDDRKKIEENKNLREILNKHDDSGIGPDKKFNRAFIKLIDEYGGNFNKIGDLTRARVVSKDLDESIQRVVDFIKTSTHDENITNVSVVDSTGEPISIPKKASGYRDIKIFVKLKSGNTMEVQFQVEDMYKVKDEGLDLEIDNDENKKIFEKMKKEGAGLTVEDMLELLEFSKERNIKLPTKNILEKMSIEDLSSISWEKYNNILVTKEITTDFTYAISRQMDKNSQAGKKITRLERILADSAWSKIVLKYLKNKEIQVD